VLVHLYEEDGERTPEPLTVCSPSPSGTAAAHPVSPGADRSGRSLSTTPTPRRPAICLCLRTQRPSKRYPASTGQGQPAALAIPRPQLHPGSGDHLTAASTSSAGAQPDGDARRRASASLLDAGVCPGKGVENRGRYRGNPDAGGDAVERRMISDVRSGLPERRFRFQCVVAFMAGSAAGRVKTFSIVSPAKKFDELGTHGWWWSDTGRSSRRGGHAIHPRGVGQLFEHYDEPSATLRPFRRSTWRG